MQKIAGFYWHVHHDTLMEWCYDYKERANFIRSDKHKNEQKLRLRLFQPVHGSLPREVIKAWRVYDKACEEVVRACDKARKLSYDVRACDKARRACDEALINNMPAIEALHKKECHNCPWDGHTIFPKA